MAFIFFNPNPAGKFVGDCVIRAISKATGQSWEKTYIGIVEKGLNMRDMPSANRVWAAYLKDLGFNKYIIPNTCPECYSIRDFAYENPNGVFILGTGTHVVCVCDGNYYDTWDSGDETPIYFLKKELLHNGLQGIR